MKNFTLALFAMLTMASTSASALTVNDFAGTYTENVTGQNFYYGSWADNVGGNHVTVTAMNDTTLFIRNLCGFGDMFYGTVNFDDRTITIPASSAGYYIFCSYNSNGSDDPSNFTATGKDAIIGTFNEEGTEIVINNWAYYYESSNTIYSYGTSTLSKHIAQWSLPATYDNGEWGSGKCTIVSYGTFFSAVDWPVKDYTLSFTFDPTTQTVSLLNADYEPSDEYPGYWYYYVTSGIDIMLLYTDEGMSSLELTETGGKFTLTYEWYEDMDNEDPTYSGTATITWPDLTGIAGVAADKNVSQKSFFDLSGRRMLSTSGKKGIVISDGKKFFAK